MRVQVIARAGFRIGQLEVVRARHHPATFAVGAQVIDGLADHLVEVHPPDVHLLAHLLDLVVGVPVQVVVQVVVEHQGAVRHVPRGVPVVHLGPGVG